jgi:hypothetical protein
VYTGGSPVTTQQMTDNFRTSIVEYVCLNQKKTGLLFEQALLNKFQKFPESISRKMLPGDNLL